MARRVLCSPNHSFKFREGSSDLLKDFLVNLNERNKENLSNLSKCTGNFKNERLIAEANLNYIRFSVGHPALPHHAQLTPPPCIPLCSDLEFIFLITKDLRLDPLVGYHATELLQRFMVKHLTDLLTAAPPQDAAAHQPGSCEDAVFDKIKERFPLIIFSCVQLASKLSLHSHIIDNNTAVHFLHSVGHSVSKQTLLESELTILKGLEFRLKALNPLTFVEILLEVLGHNEPSVPVERLYDLCQHVLQFVTLQRTTIYDALLKTTARCVSPSTEQREKFLVVTEDCMLLGVGVIAVAAFILYVRQWKQVVGELSHITGISRRSISDFAHVTLMHLVNPASLQHQLES